MGVRAREFPPTLHVPGEVCLWPLSFNIGPGMRREGGGGGVKEASGDRFDGRAGSIREFTLAQLQTAALFSFYPLPPPSKARREKPSKFRSATRKIVQRRANELERTRTERIRKGFFSIPIFSRPLFSSKGRKALSLTLSYRDTRISRDTDTGERRKLTRRGYAYLRVPFRDAFFPP